MPIENIDPGKMREAHEVLGEFAFDIKELNRGYSDRALRIDLDKNEITILPVTQQMKDLWTGGKGFDLWLMFREINRDTDWDSHENPLCFSPGPLGGATSFPGSGKTIVTAVSPLTHAVMDCNVGGYFGPFLKFAGFDALVIVGKAREETIIIIDAVGKKITIERAPEESIDSHVLVEELTEMYAEDDLDKRNIAVVSAGRGAQHTRMGVLNFSFWDWRRQVARMKQAGRGGMGTVFRNKNLKALVLKNRDITPAWRVEENKVAGWVSPKKISTQGKGEIAELDAIIEKWADDPEYVIEMMQDIQERFRRISKTAVDRLLAKTGVPKAYLYHIATFDKFFTLEEKEPAAAKADKPAAVIESSKLRLMVLRNNGAAEGGYRSLGKVLAENDPEGITREVTKSGLRDRLDGTPVGIAWASAYNAGKERSEGVYIVCSAGEGDPGARVSRGILESDPHSVIEGMIIGAYAVGASEGFIAIRKEHECAGERLNQAIEAARKKGFLGERIQGTDFCFDIRIHRIGGASVLGEPTSLITAMSGRAGDSHAKYIPIGERGFRGKPTLVNNVETWANIPVIVEKGAGWFSSIGTEGSTGTKVFFVTGNVRNAGLVEVPMGTTLREIVPGIAGSSPGGGTLKAVQIGGAAGGFIPANLLDMGVDFDTLSEAGAIMGSGTINVIGDNTCIVAEVLRAVEFLSEESCGTCTPCREGLYALKNTLTRICSGEGKQGDIELLEDTAKTMLDTSLCRFGVYASTPVLSTLRYFRDEYREHIGQKKCRAGECKHKA
jgi:NADH:ubiquinone oxidoreductase subunit F (NADH-binding)